MRGRRSFRDNEVGFPAVASGELPVSLADIQVDRGSQIHCGLEIGGWNQGLENAGDGDLRVETEVFREILSFP